MSQLQATCADINLDVPDKQPFPCAEGNLPNPAAVNATSPTNKVCCLVSEHSQCTRQLFTKVENAVQEN
jgi:hypothetical protein